MLDYAMKLTTSPAAMSAKDAEKLRSERFDDRTIHDICAVTAYFAFVNRMADGLGGRIREEIFQSAVGILHFAVYTFRIEH